MERTSTSTDRVSGLDSLRFVCALWVFFSHGAAPELPNPFAEGTIPHFALHGFLRNIWTGPAAVIIFFVISGFCIHFPFAGSNKQPRLKEFYTRRFIRLLIPLLVAVPVSTLMGVRFGLFQYSILWSLIAELIYYLFYPLLQAAHLRFGSWRGIVAFSFVAAAVVAATNPSAGDYPSYGPGLNWLLGLPCWLLGCVVAESTRREMLPEVSTSNIWTWRTVIFGAACACSILRFHSPLGYPWTLNLFAVAVAFWLRREIAFRRRVAPSRFLEWAGLWSYSLYLLHVPAHAWYGILFPTASRFAFGWAAKTLFVLLVCYALYLLVERPSHALARMAAKRFRPTAGVALTANPA